MEKTAPSHTFFSNTECRYFPCHQGVEAERFNCMFCFCPLYSMDDCGGEFRLTTSGVKDCSACTLPHMADAHDGIVRRLRAKNAHGIDQLPGKTDIPS